MDLSAAEIRVLGSLVEKQLTTPQQYPLTLNALTLACSQSSNRDPVVALRRGHAPRRPSTSVKTKGLVRFVHPSHGRSALRYGHTLDEALGLDTRPLALLAVLMLRGPQTLGELRTRTERMVQFADLREVEAELDALARLGPSPWWCDCAGARGRKRTATPSSWAVRSPHPTPGIRTPRTPAPRIESPSRPPRRATIREPGRPPRWSTLRVELEELRGEVGELRRALDEPARASSEPEPGGPRRGGSAMMGFALRPVGNTAGRPQSTDGSPRAMMMEGR